MGIFAHFKSAEKFFSKSEASEIVAAIQAAEQKTTGEIRVHLENRCGQVEPLHRTVDLFHELCMHETEQRNAVLLYIAVRDHKFAIYGDEGLNNLVPDNFWWGVTGNLKLQFNRGHYLQGVLNAIEEVSTQLNLHFPGTSTDKNELSDEISFGN